MADTLVHAVHTAHGQVAAARRDAVVADVRRGAFAVSSGPPASGSGRSAAEIVLTTLGEHLDPLVDAAEKAIRGEGSMDRVKNVFRGVFEIASGTLRTAYGVKTTPETSATVLVCRAGRGIVSHVGRTRGYVMRKGQIARITQDLIGVERKHDESTRIAVPALDPAHLAQSLGQGSPLEVECVTFQLAPGTLVALVSEGIAQQLRGHELLTASQNARGLGDAAETMTRMASQRQIAADSTALLVAVASMPGS